MIVKGCVIFERTLLSRKKSHNLAWSCAISNNFYCALWSSRSSIKRTSPDRKRKWKTDYPTSPEPISVNLNTRNNSNQRLDLNMWNSSRSHLVDYMYSIHSTNSICLEWFHLFSSLTIRLITAVVFFVYDWKNKANFI